MYISKVLKSNICTRKQFSFPLIWRKKTLLRLTSFDLRKRSSSSLEGGKKKGNPNPNPEVGGYWIMMLEEGASLAEQDKSN